MSVTVTMTYTLDVPAITRRLRKDEREILTNYADEAVVAIKAKWTGWKYVGRDPQSVGRSRAGWKRKVSATQPFSLQILNEARGYYNGKPYVAYVARSKGAKPEWEVVMEDIIEPSVPRVEAQLRDAILANLSEPGQPVTVRPNRASAVVRATFT